MPKPQDEAEEGDGKLATDPEIEAAMREAEEALDAASAEASAGEPTPAGEPAEADTESDLAAATASAFLPASHFSYSGWVTACTTIGIKPWSFPHSSAH